MTARNTETESTIETKGAPIKRLVLRRETVRDLKVRTGVKTGDGSSSAYCQTGGDSLNPTNSVASHSVSVISPPVPGLD